MVAVLIMQPHSAVLRANRCNQRFTVRGHRNPFLRGRAESDLFGCSVGKTLAPDVKLVSLNREVDPLPVRRPATGKTSLAGRTNNADVAIATKGSDTAWHQVATAIHFDHQYPSPIRRQIGMMGHAAVAWRNVH